MPYVRTHSAARPQHARTPASVPPYIPHHNYTLHTTKKQNMLSHIHISCTTPPSPLTTNHLSRMCNTYPHLLSHHLLFTSSPPLYIHKTKTSTNQPPLPFRRKQDILTILFSTCTRHLRLPSFSRAFNTTSSSRRGGYGNIRVGDDGRRRGVIGRTDGGTTVEDPMENEENRLIDQLDEEWDD